MLLILDSIGRGNEKFIEGLKKALVRGAVEGRVRQRELEDKLIAQYMQVSATCFFCARYREQSMSRYRNKQIRTTAGFTCFITRECS